MNDDRDSAPVELEIDTARKRRVLGWAVYIFIYLGVSALLVLVFAKLSTPLGIAIGVVAFMVGYMTLMGILASRNLHRRER
jgi:hypothetical protein